MQEIIVFASIMLFGLAIFILMKGKKVKNEGQPTQNYDDKIDRVVDQLDKL